MKKTVCNLMAIAIVLLTGCSGSQQAKEETTQKFTGAKGEVKLIILDPGHFHASLVQKTMYDQIDPTVHVYAPDGPDVQTYLNRINDFNTRAENPTHWIEKVYTGDDYLQKMLKEKPGNVLVVSGNNEKKTEYIKAAIDAGINVYADKPMAINSADYELLKEAFQSAKEHDVLLYDIMTERYEITTIVQRQLSMMPEIFGELAEGTLEEPAITKESVHHFFKYVAGNPIKRPGWFFDTEQQGEGTVDITTHLVDLVQWEAFPNQALQPSDVKMLQARRWPTALSLAQFSKVTQLDEFPDFLNKDIVDGKLNVYSNGEFTYLLKGKYAKVSVVWNFQAPEGAGDTHYSIMHGTNCDIFIKQGEEQNYMPEVYIRLTSGEDASTFEAALKKAVESTIASEYPGLKLVKLNDDLWTVNIPQKYKIGHEAHFEQVTQKYLRYLTNGDMPDWEIPCMLTKYYTTTQAFDLSKK